MFFCTILQVEEITVNKIMKNYAKRETFYLLTKEEEKMNNKWILCYYLNAFSLSHFLALASCV